MLKRFMFFVISKIKTHLSFGVRLLCYNFLIFPFRTEAKHIIIYMTATHLLLNPSNHFRIKKSQNCIIIQGYEMSTHIRFFMPCNTISGVPTITLLTRYLEHSSILLSFLLFCASTLTLSSDSLIIQGNTTEYCISSL